MTEEKEILKLKRVKVIFANLVDEGFGTSITIDATDPQIQKEISEWVKENNIGKAPNAGKAQFKEYQPEDGEKVIQYSFKVNDFTKYKSLVEGMDKNSLGYGAIVSLIVNAFEYNNKFGKGMSASVNSVVIHKGREDGSADLDAFMEELSTEEEPF